MGKAPVGVAAAAKRHGVPVICLSGGLGDGAEQVLARGIDALATVVPGPMRVEEAMAGGEALIEAAAARVCRLLRVGLLIQGRDQGRGRDQDLSESTPERPTPSPII
jgi:glycerate kinase